MIEKGRLFSILCLLTKMDEIKMDEAYLFIIGYKRKKVIFDSSNFR